MHLEIISPEAKIYSGEVSSVSVPGEAGSFQILDNHAPIVSNLKKGSIMIEGNLKIKDEFKERFLIKNGKTFFEINSGTVENSNNNVIILSD
jgi:F-type H+-transporting ATPase subunit epsilon|tara:strand:- start:578 stop:853 length:276 start_codon:yes stop_codon:yes gene_type:complete